MALALIAITCIVRVLGFTEKQVIAYRFGLGGAVDAWFIAVSVPTLLFLLTRELVEPAYLPVFMRHLDSKDPRRAWRLFTLLLIAVAMINVLAAAGAYYGADVLARWLGPGLSPEDLGLAGALIRASTVGGLFLSVSSLTYITMNGCYRFVVPALGDVFLKMASIGCILLLAAEIGPFALATGFVLGAAGRLSVHFAGLWRYRPLDFGGVRQGEQDMRTVLTLIAPLFLGVFFAQLSDLAANYFSSLAGPGAVAARTFAKKIVDLPILLVPYAVSVVAFPHFVDVISRGAFEVLARRLDQALFWLAILFSAAAVSTILASESVVALIFQRGAFTADATQATAHVLIAYASGLVAFAVEPLLVTLFFSLRDTRTPIAVGIACVLIEVALAAALLEPFGVFGVAAALSIAKSLKVATLWLILKRRAGESVAVPATRGICKLAIAIALAWIGVVCAMSYWPAPPASAPLVSQFAYCSVIGALSLVLHAVPAITIPGAQRGFAIDVLSHLLGWRRPEGAEP